MSEAFDGNTIMSRVVSGALYDLVGYLTSRDEEITMSGNHEAATAVRALSAFMEARNMPECEPLISTWREFCG